MNFRKNSKRPLTPRPPTPTPNCKFSINPSLKLCIKVHNLQYFFILKMALPSPLELFWKFIRFGSATRPLSLSPSVWLSLALNFGYHESHLIDFKCTTNPFCSSLTSWLQLSIFCHFLGASSIIWFFSSLSSSLTSAFWQLSPRAVAQLAHGTGKGVQKEDLLVLYFAYFVIIIFSALFFSCTERIFTFSKNCPPFPPVFFFPAEKVAA